MVNRLVYTLAAVCLLSPVTSRPAIAQSRTSAGLFGQTTTGTAASVGRTSGGTISNTGTLTNNTGTGSSGTSGGTGGGTTTNTGNVAAESAANNLANQAIQLQQTPGQFVGADSQDAVNLRSMQAAGQSRTGAQSGMNQLQNLFSQGLQQLNQQTQRAARPQIRVPLRIGFQPQSVSVAHVRRFESHLAKLPAIRFIGPAQVVMEGRTAILRGTVATEDDRRLAERLAMMQPEILAVKNELQVDSSATTASPGPEALPPATAP